eukprot:CAMPEP_0118980472 /NCGR_PEP_ID=MMETSP1173-20130426/28412_1 /TAXON_ID=1034831 /ORGANISM="Rhizochromulina marina cf, Strain CCMP1243" /LENGTH=81 /DNA_ID=CAMNT_0006930815 /DNA_START=167 /DNA_END=409 /DNA_ORIENTATION=-
MLLAIIPACEETAEASQPVVSPAGVRRGDETSAAVFLELPPLLLEPACFFRLLPQSSFQLTLKVGDERFWSGRAQCIRGSG